MSFLIGWLKGASPPGQFAIQTPSNNTLPGVGSDQTGPFVALQFDDPHLNGLPLWGVGGGGVTIVRKVKVLATTGYMTFLTWSRGDGNFSAGDGYWIHTGYPSNQSTSGTTHIWEISTDGKDIVDASGNNVGAGGASPTTISVGTTYLQVITITRTCANSKTQKFLFNLPDTTTAGYIQATTTTSNYGESNPTTPKLTRFDSPWYGNFQHERASMVWDAEKIFSPALTQADAILEAANFSSVVTPAGQAAIWWGKDGFNSLDDQVCQFTGRSGWYWADSGNKGTLVARL